MFPNHRDCATGQDTSLASVLSEKNFSVYLPFITFLLHEGQPGHFFLPLADILGVDAIRPKSDRGALLRVDSGYVIVTL